MKEKIKKILYWPIWLKIVITFHILILIFLIFISFRLYQGYQQEVEFCKMENDTPGLLESIKWEQNLLFRKEDPNLIEYHKELYLNDYCKTSVKRQFLQFFNFY